MSFTYGLLLGTFAGGLLTALTLVVFIIKPLVDSIREMKYMGFRNLEPLPKLQRLEKYAEFKPILED